MFDDILDQAAAELIHLPDAARAEVWVSAVFGGWRQPGIADGLEPEAIDAEFLSLLRASASEAALALATAATAMGIDGAADVVTELQAAGVRPPYWAETVGTARAVDAWVVHDDEVGADSVIIEFEHDDELRHSMLVEIDHQAAVDILFGPGGFVETLELDGERSLHVGHASIDEAAARIRAGLDRTAAEPDPAVTEEFMMNVVLAVARLEALGGGEVSIPAVSSSTAPAFDGDPEADAYARQTLEAALRDHLRSPEPGDLDAAVESFDALVADGDPDVLLLLAEAGRSDAAGIDALVAAVGAYVTPGPLSAFAAPHRELISMLEWADWLGAVIQTVRSGAGTPVTPASLVDGINRCPEVVDTIPKSERRAVETAFDLVLHAWTATGVLDDDNRLTDVGAWVLPRALLDAWSPRGEAI